MFLSRTGMPKAWNKESRAIGLRPNTYGEQSLVSPGGKCHHRLKAIPSTMFLSPGEYGGSQLTLGVCPEAVGA